MIPFEAIPGLPDQRVTVWEHPKPGRTYVAGADFGYGIGRDADAVVILDITDKPPRQVAEMHGQWGEALDEPLVKMLGWYNDAFLVGEHQVGGPIMARMHRVHGYPHMYREHREDTLGKPMAPRYGYARRYDDITLRNFRRAIMDKKIVLRSMVLIEQMRQLNWYSPSTNDAHHNDDDLLRMRLPINDAGRRPSPDLVMAACYAWHASAVRPAAEPEPKPKYTPGNPMKLSEHQLLELDR
jgi:hypothetical protein